MTTTTVAEYKITYKQILDENGALVDETPNSVKDNALLLKMYKMMMLTRTFDTKAIALQRTGKMGTYPSTLGQEAISVAIGAAMKEEDVLCPYYREIGAQFWRGVKMEEIFSFWGGNENGSNYQHGAFKDFPICVPISSQNLHAVGAATAFKLKGEKRVAVAVVGDGGTSRGDFYEAINTAGVWNLPAVFVVNNNQWAISVPREEQTKAKTIAQKGISGEVRSLQVDGNDLFAVKEAVDEALELARNGKGPSVIEAITYRMCDHTTADDARRYRSDSELEANRKKDPITRLKKYLISCNIWDEEKDTLLQQDCADEVVQAVDIYLNEPKRNPAEMFNYLYETLPESYEWQREEVANATGGNIHD